MVSLAARVCALLLLLATSYCAVAQEETNSAVVTVAVSDTLGGAIPNARVHVLERSSKKETEKLTGETGDATLALQPGTFDFTVKGPAGSYTSFQDTIITDVDLKPSEHRHIKVVLKVWTSCCTIVDFGRPNEPIEPESAEFGDLEEPTWARMPIGMPATLTGLVNASEDVCAKTAHLRTYSDAVFVQDAGDVVGRELVVQRRNANSVAALLYVYEGVPDENGISVSGRISGGQVTMKGNWVQHLTEEPSKKQVVETRPVEISGTLDSKHFQGTIAISGSAESVALKRVEHIWMCRAKP